MEIELEVGGLHLLLSPTQFHAVLDLVNGFLSPSKELNTTKRPFVMHMFTLFVEIVFKKCRLILNSVGFLNTVGIKQYQVSYVTGPIGLILLC